MKTGNNKKQTILDYYHSFESTWGYILVLKGIRHFGFYPLGEENISIYKAQMNMADFLGTKLQLPKNSRILDAGCGEGNVALHLAKKYKYKIIGVDLLDISIERAGNKSAKEKLNTLVKFKVADYTRLNYPDGYFDGIYTMETFVHIQDYKNALIEFKRLLRPGGRLVMFEYTIKPQKDLTSRQQRTLQDVIEGSGMFGLTYFLHGTFPKILAGAGFVNVFVEEITDRIKPMLKRFYQICFIPYYITKFLHLRKGFTNSIFAVEMYKDIVEDDVLRYVTMTAEKPQT